MKYTDNNDWYDSPITGCRGIRHTRGGSEEVSRCYFGYRRYLNDSIERNIASGFRISIWTWT